MRGFRQPTRVLPVALLSTNSLTQVRCLRSERSDDAQDKVARCVLLLRAYSLSDDLHILELRDDLNLSL